MNIIELAKQSGIVGLSIDSKHNLKQLEAFATAIAKQAVEDYKAGLVPVMWWDGDSDYADDVMLPSIRQSHIDKNSSMYLDYPIPLYALQKYSLSTEEQSILKNALLK